MDRSLRVYGLPEFIGPEWPDLKPIGAAPHQPFGLGRPAVTGPYPRWINPRRPSRSRARRRLGLPRQAFEIDQLASYTELSPHPVAESVPVAAAAVSIGWGIVAVLVGRAIVVYGLLGGAARLERRVGLVRPPLPLAWLHVMNWSGLRGAVAVALALSIPEATPDRELLQGIVFGVVLFTLLVQGTTAARVLRWAGIQGDGGPSAGEFPAYAQQPG